MSSGREMCGCLLLRVLVLCQNLARPDNNLMRQARQLRHFNTVTAIRCPGLDLSQEDNPAANLFNRNVKILYPESCSASSVSSK